MSSTSGGTSRRDRKLTELANIEFVGSLGKAFGDYAAVLRSLSTRWNTELELASEDAFAALTAVKSRRGLLERPLRRERARRVVRRLLRAQNLVAGLTKRAERLPKEYARQFLSTPEAAKKVIEKGRGGS